MNEFLNITYTLQMLRSDKAKICLAICEDGVTLIEEEEEDDEEGEGGGAKGETKDEGKIYTFC
jgi:hypothetical protein